MQIGKLMAGVGGKVLAHILHIMAINVKKSTSTHN